MPLLRVLEERVGIVDAQINLSFLSGYIIESFIYCPDILYSGIYIIEAIKMKLTELDKKLLDTEYENAFASKMKKTPSTLLKEFEERLAVSVQKSNPQGVLYANYLIQRATNDLEAQKMKEAEKLNASKYEPKASRFVKAFGCRTSELLNYKIQKILERLFNVDVKSPAISQEIRFCTQKITDYQNIAKKLGVFVDAKEDALFAESYFMTLYHGDSAKAIASVRAEMADPETSSQRKNNLPRIEKILNECSTLERMLEKRPGIKPLVKSCSSYCKRVA